MLRRLLLVALVACEAPPSPPSPPVHWVYAPIPSAWPLGEVRGRIGRGTAPQPAASRGITGAFDTPLRLSTPWTVPGDGRVARAVLYGLDGDRPAVELVEIDRGHVAWRDTKECAAPVVGVTSDAIVCADVHGTRAIGLDGKPRWKSDAPFIAISADRVVTAGSDGSATILDANTGVTLAEAALPAGVTTDLVVGACGDAGHELYASLRDGTLAQILDHKIAWSFAAGNLAAIDACDGTLVLATAATDAGTTLYALDRQTGRLAGHVSGVRGYWPARDGSDRIEISTLDGVASWPRDLFAGEPLDLPPLGELLAKRADRRLVRATPLTAVVLDRSGVRAYVPLSEFGAALGDDTFLAASWLGAPGRTARLASVPRPWRQTLRLLPPHAALAVPAELRDLPVPVALEVGGAVPRESTAARSVAAVALDPIGPALYAATLEHDPDDASSAGVARFDLVARTWRWHRADACGLGAPIGLAATRDVIVCAAGRPGEASVIATSRDGAAMWTWQGQHLDAITAAADVILAFDAARAVVLDAADGHLLGTLASDDGAAVRAAALDIGDMAVIVTSEQGRVVARLPHAAMAPAWSIAVDGVVQTIIASGDGVVVELEGGDAYRIDVRTAAIVAMPGLDLVWRAPGDVVTGEAAGGPVPPEKMPVAPGPALYHPTDLETAPAIATPWPLPSPMADSWQLTLYEPGGGLRARNDYALAAPIAPAAARGGGASPLVVSYGPGLREVLVIDPARGDPVKRVVLPDDAPRNVTFATIVDGRPIAGTILAGPLRVVLF